MTVSIETSATVREIDGYRLVQRIGAGGYGEVWRADAPGGLSKAVKLVFGFHDEARASRELKALTRIKDLRHPFLLSLERIEVIDAQLVVVTELADGCLKDRFDECRGQGLPGIPREELLRFLADAAEALDYMNEVHSLQHLDVKPENLLIIGSHAKVADFGLVKSIQDVTASMMAGLTPLYASPEVFHDQPSRQSDQYSLAIVYQEMLSGTLPFPGKNLAQLTAQHLNSPPRLNPLPPRDRDILSKALAKKPAERYRNCREMIDALLAAGSAAHLPQVRSGSYPGEASSKTDTKTIHGNDTKSSAGEASQPFEPDTIRMDRDTGVRQIRSSQVWEEIAPRQQSIRPPVEDGRQQRQLRPTVVVSIGGLGSRIVRNLIDRRQELVGPEPQHHWCQCLAIDTDTTDLMQSTGQLGATTATPGLSTLEMPLRRPQAYRNLSAQLTRSLSRRWLYNIPLSLKTEGMRPLGRLAFADHAGRLRDQLGQTLQQAVEVATVNLDPNSEDYLWQSRPRIVLVLSSSGGTGSGMVWDAFALAQEVIQQFGAQPRDVSLWLLHTTAQGTEQQDLARCNTYACLRELFHFQITGEYPGDAVTKISPQHWDDSLARQVTLFHLGHDPQQREREAEIQDIADLLYLDVYEGRQAIYQQPVESQVSEPREPSVSAWTFTGQALTSSGHLDITAARFSLELLRRWQGACHSGQEQRRLAQLSESTTATSAREEQFRRLLELRAAKVLHEVNFGLESTIDQVAEVVADEIDATPERYFSEIIGRLVKELSDKGISGSTEMTAEMLDSLDQLIGSSNREMEAGPLMVVSLHSEIGPHVRQIGAHHQGQILEQIHAILNEPSFRVRGVRQLAAQVDQKLWELEEKARSMGQRTAAEIDKVRAAMFPTSPRNSKRSGRAAEPELTLSELRALWLKYALLRTHSVVLVSSCQVFQHLRAAILRDNLWIKNTQSALEMAERQVRQKLALEESPAADDPKFLERILQLEQTVDQVLAAEYGGLCRLLDEDRNAIDKLVRVMVECGKDLARQVALEEGSDWQHAQPLHNRTSWEECLALSACRLTQLGSEVQRVVFLPDGISPVQADAYSQASLLGTNIPKLLWMEAGGQVPLREAARLLIENRPDYVPVADRLLTRADIHWADL